MYQFIRSLLFALDPERAHQVALQSLQLCHHLRLGRFIQQPSAPRQVMGLTFPNPIGLAAGLDKNGEFIDALALLGFGFIEIGTITPKPQLGNPRPRLFRLVEEEAIINRMGFNNKGAEYVVKRLESMQYKGILGINIGKNKDTPLDKAIDDYLLGFQYFAPFASYITINISSPNTPGLRELQQEDFLLPLLDRLKKEQKQVLLNRNKYIPLVVKIAPDLSSEALEKLAEILLQQQVDGVIATNTTITRPTISKHRYHDEQGGLSGGPLSSLSTQVLNSLHTLLHGKIPLIGSGGLMHPDQAVERFQAGANLLQLYTGFIYYGPNLIKKCVEKALVN